MRNNFASIPSNTIGAIIFTFIAFYGVVDDLTTMIITIAVIEAIMILIDTPIAYLIRGMARKMD